MSLINEFLKSMQMRKGSDLHVIAGDPPRMRVHGDLITLQNQRLDAEEENVVIAPRRPRQRPTCRRAATQRNSGVRGTICGGCYRRSQGESMAGRPSNFHKLVKGETVEKQSRGKGTSTARSRSQQTRAASSRQGRRRSTISERPHMTADRTRRSRRSTTRSSRSKKR